MVEPVTVWRVHLRRGDVRDREGTLRLDDDALVFEDRETAGETRLEISAIRSAKRVKASPILLVAHDDGGDRIETAFYFSQPPPLETSTGPVGGSSARPALGPLAAMQRSSKRRHQRENVRYLTARGGNAKQAIQEWVEEIGERRTR